MNAFAILGLEARPLIDPEVLKEAHLRAVARDHPDANPTGSSERVREVNQAREILSRDRSRLLHLIDCTGEGSASTQAALPGTLGDLFGPVAETLGRVRAQLRSHAGAESALEKAGLMPAGLALFDDLQALRQKILSLRGEWEQRLREVDAAWVEGRPDNRALAEIALVLGFLDRWTEQIDEQAFRLSETLA
ncbi:MAG: J domain-containing protein [Candidatus Methylacidiphilales bacterium]|nr:J domain-containing protein [Candidatus Methylacidiphilales bacterium]